MLIKLLKKQSFRGYKKLDSLSDLFEDFSKIKKKGLTMNKKRKKTRISFLLNWSKDGILFANRKQSILTKKKEKVKVKKEKSRNGSEITIMP